ncbi:MAG: hypothetical protein FJ405_16660 [Verrucomicrobia bacterium]|nr:hypothetical protein [Verrucomicrobiota bacterium]
MNSGMAGDWSFVQWLKRSFDRPAGPGFTPSNVFRSGPGLPPDVRRVVVMPLVVPPGSELFRSAQQTLEPLIDRELMRSRRFEVVTVSPLDLKRWTGRSHWRADEELPPELFDKLQEQYACQAVVFAQLTQFQAYAPLEIGWRFRMVDSRGQEVFWAADEIFNAGEKRVATAARRHVQDQQNEGHLWTDSSFALHSPWRFGQYTLHALFETLPSR